MSRECFIHYRRNVLHYVKAGNGENPLLVFHGYGQDHTSYVPLLQSLSPRYTIYIVNLFFHGKSEWNDGEQTLEKSTWNEIVRILLEDNNIDRFSVLAYSLGGRFALATLEGFANRIKGIFLIAPDGIAKNFWYNIATYPTPFRSLFRSMITHHDRFERIASWLGKRGLVSKNLIRFADYQMNSETKRKRVYYTWVVFRHMRSDLKQVASLINTHQIKLTIVTGKHDDVIPAQGMRRLLEHVKDYRHEVIEAGHLGLISRSLHLLVD